jgi:hypothetical protein
MPLNAKGKKILASMEKKYGKKKGKTVFYAMENSGKLKRIKKAYSGDFMTAETSNSMYESGRAAADSFQASYSRLVMAVVISKLQDLKQQLQKIQVVVVLI